MVQREVAARFANLLPQIVMALGVIDLAVLVDWSDEESQNIVQIRVIGLDGDVVVPRNQAILLVSLRVRTE